MNQTTNQTNMLRLTPEEEKLAILLDDGTYTPEYLSQWINRNDNVQCNAYAALNACCAKGYYQAIQRLASYLEQNHILSLSPSETTTAT